MKKTLLAILGVLCAATIALSVLSACGGGGGTGGDGGTGGTEQTYDVTAPDGEGYDVEVDKNTAKFGDKVTITVEVTDPDKYIESVNANSYELSENTDGTYTATITEDTTISVKLADYEEVTSVDGVIFSNNNVTTIVKGSSSPDTYDDHTWNLRVNFNWVNTYTLSNRSSVTSSNQNVIPDDAITYTSRSDSAGSGKLQYATVSIDTSKLNEGYAYLVMYFQSNNSSYTKGTLCIKITVADRIDLETMKETVVIDYNGFAEEGDDVVVRFIDADYVDGSYIDGEPAQPYLEFKTKVDADGTNTFDLDYVKGHSYSISIYKGTEWYDGYLNTEEKQKNTLMIDDSEQIFGPSSSVTGYNQYKDGELSLVTEGLTVELKVEETFYDRNNKSN